MLTSLPIIIAFLIAIGIPPVRLSRKFIKIHWWDYALPAIGLPVWIFLTLAEVGKTASLSNMVIEIIIVLGISVIIPWARVPEKSQALFFHFFETTLPWSGSYRFFLKFIKPELANTIISFLKPGVAGGIPCPRCPRLAIWYD